MQSAGDDIIEKGKVVGDVEGDAVICCPAANVDADGGEFAPRRPCACSAFDTASLNTKGKSRLNNEIFIRNQKVVKALLSDFEADNGINDKLSGRVERDIASPVGINDGDSADGFAI